MQVGIVGLPNVGKSTIFNAMSSGKAEVANYPFCTIEPNVGVVEVPDERLDALTKLFNSKKVVPPIVEFLDIAGLVKGASKGEGLGNQFLSNIRDVDAIIEVVRAFEDENVVNVNGSVDPLRDIEIIETELLLKDLEVVEKRFNRVEKQLRTGAKEVKEEFEFLKKANSALVEGKPLRTLDLHDDDFPFIRNYGLLTAKKIIYIANVSEEQIGGDVKAVEQIKKYASEFGGEVLTICAKLEAEIAQLPEGEREDYVQALGMGESGLHKVIRASYKALGLITFYTAGEKESHAWSIKKGLSAVEAAGAVHTDMQRGFIAAEIISYDDMIKYGGYAKVKEAGKMKLVGKEHIVQDGDIVVFRFNV